MQIYDFVFNFWLPFILSFTLIFAILEGMKIFERKINITIALIVTLGFSASPFFQVFAKIIVSYSAIFVILAFFSLFVIGTSKYSLKRLKMIEIKDKLRLIEEELEKRRKEYEEAIKSGDEVKARILKNEIEKLEERKDILLRIAEKR